MTKLLWDIKGEISSFPNIYQLPILWIFRWYPSKWRYLSYFGTIYKVDMHSPEFSHVLSLRWRHNERDGISNHHPHDCFLNRIFRRRSKKTYKFRATGLCGGNSPHKGPVTRKCFHWWRHQFLQDMETLSVLLSLCEGIPPVYAPPPPPHPTPPTSYQLFQICIFVLHFSFLYL